MTFRNEKEVDEYIDSLTVEQLKNIAKKQAIWHIRKEKSPVYQEGTFGHLLQQHCDSPMYCSVGFEIYSSKDNQFKFYHDFAEHKPFTEIAKIFEEYLNCKIKGIRSEKDGKMFKLDSGFGSVYKVLLEI